MACLDDCFVDFGSFGLWKWLQDCWIPFNTKINEFFTNLQSDFPIVLLSFESGFVDKFNEPLNDRKDIIDIKTLELEGLKIVWTLHVFKGGANVLGDFNFLADLHFIIVVDVDLEVGWCDTPSNSADDFVEGFKRGDSDSEVAGKKENFIDLLEPWIVLWIVVNDLCHWVDIGMIFEL